MTVDELKVLITAQTAQLQNEVTKVQKKMNRLEKTAKNTSNGIKKAFNAIKFTAIIAAVIKLTKVCTTAAGDLVEVQNVVDTAFGESANIVNNWSKNVIKQYGMSETAAKRTASTFMAMSNGMGIANKAGTTMAVTLAGLSADLASFWNTSQDEAFTALKSVYTGETETLKKQQNFFLSHKIDLSRLRDQKTPETRINTMFLRVLGVSFIACFGGAFSANGAQMVPKSHAGL